MADIEELEKALILSRQSGVGAAKFKELIDCYKIPSLALEIWQTQLAPNKRMSSISLNKKIGESFIKQTIARLLDSSFYASYYGEEAYPKGLRSLKEPPPVIFTSSKLKDVPLAAVVGARNADKCLLEKAEAFTSKLIEKGYGIVSGGAMGIDRVAHETALKKNAYTIGVLATGIDVVYPPEHEKLFEEIKSNGALMTELMCSTPPAKGFFPTRCRIIVAMSELVAVFPSKSSKGSFITANWAKRLNRELIVFKNDE